MRFQAPSLPEFASPYWGRSAMFLLILVVASHWSTTPAGLAALLAATALAYARPRLGLALLFGASFLPYVYGLPFTANFLVVMLLAPLLVVRWRELMESSPRLLTALVGVIGVLVAATYPAHRSPDLLLLAFSLLGLVEAVLLVRASGGRPDDVLRDLGLGICAALFVPFLSNMAFVVNSPFWLPDHLGMLSIGRITVSFTEPNVVAAYLATSYVVLLLSVRLAGRPPWRHGASILLLLLLLLATFASGSRAAMLFAGAATAAILLVAQSRVATGAVSAWPCWRTARLLCLGVIAAGLAVGMLGTAAGVLEVPGLARLAATRDIEQTGRPKSFRDAAAAIDAVPLAGIDYIRYTQRAARHTPHNSILAALMFLGLLVTIPYLVLLLVPVLDLALGRRLGRSPPISVAVASLFLITQTIPLTTERGLLVLVGVWYALSALPKSEPARAATPARVASSLSG